MPELQGSAVDIFRDTVYDITTMGYRIVVDTNVFVSALRSRRGASYRLLTLIGTGDFEIAVSVPLVLEYESAAKKVLDSLPLSESYLDDILDYICSVATRRKIHYLWRPQLGDPGDEMVLELAVESESDLIVTYNKRDFRGAERFGIRVATPKEFLEEIGRI